MLAPVGVIGMMRGCRVRRSRFRLVGAAGVRALIAFPVLAIVLVRLLVFLVPLAMAFRRISRVAGVACRSGLRRLSCRGSAVVIVGDIRRAAGVGASGGAATVSGGRTGLLLAIGGFGSAVTRPLAIRRCCKRQRKCA